MSMRKIFLLSVFILPCLYNYAGDIKYPVSAIPANLLKGANVVKRMEEETFEVISTRETIHHIKYALTILNEAGEKYATFVQFYDKLSRIKSVEGTLYDALGIQIKKAKNKDFEDESATRENLFDDYRIKAHSFYYKAYPYTVEYETEIRSDQSYSFTKWTPQPYQHLSVESSIFSFICPENYSLRYKALNYKGDPLVTSEKGKKTFTWKVSGLPEIVKPMNAPAWSELTTKVLFAPSSFEIEGYKGNASSWADLGKFQLSLHDGRDKLPDATIQKVKQLTEGLKDERAKITALYQYMQQSTRYISIQLGIGSLQPFDASFVAQKGYGDCKALSNYMYSLLKAVGIKSYCALVNSGDELDDKSIMEDFPSHQFDHMIVCVPLAKDTMWLECTNQSMPAGYMGDFTCNRKALLVTEEGGKLVSTPTYKLKENVQLRNIKGTVNDDGSLVFNANTSYKALQQDGLFFMLKALSKDRLKEILNKELDLSSYDINGFKYKEEPSDMPELNEQLDITVSNFATVSGKRLFLVPNIFNRSDRKLDIDTARKVDFVFDFEYRDEDNEEIEIPQGYQIEKGMQDITIKNKFGSYSASAKLVGNKIIYHRVREQYSGRFPAKDGAELSEYYAAIYKADRTKLVLVKDENTKTEPAKSAAQPLKSF